MEDREYGTFSGKMNTNNSSGVIKLQAARWVDVRGENL